MGFASVLCETARPLCRASLTGRDPGIGDEMFPKQVPGVVIRNDMKIAYQISSCHRKSVRFEDKLKILNSV